MVVQKLSVDDFYEIQKKDASVQMVDVREPAEFRGGAIPNSVNRPLSQIAAWQNELQKDQPVYLVCRAGTRAARASEQLEPHGHKVFVVEGGFEAWKSKTFPVTACLSRVWDLERQVRFTAGLLVIAGILLSWWVHSAFLYLSLFVGCGLVFAAVTNTCGMALMLGRCPWNQK